jgi:hypothetical protein
MAGWKGLEPSTSAVTGQRSNQLNYHPSIDTQFNDNIYFLTKFYITAAPQSVAGGPPQHRYSIFITHPLYIFFQFWQDQIQHPSYNYTKNNYNAKYLRPTNTINQ